MDIPNTPIPTNYQYNPTYCCSSKWQCCEKCIRITLVIILIIISLGLILCCININTLLAVPTPRHITPIIRDDTTDPKHPITPSTPDRSHTPPTIDDPRLDTVITAPSPGSIPMIPPKKRPLLKRWWNIYDLKLYSFYTIKAQHKPPSFIPIRNFHSAINFDDTLFTSLNNIILSNLHLIYLSYKNKYGEITSKGIPTVLSQPDFSSDCSMNHTEIYFNNMHLKACYQAKIIPTAVLIPPKLNSTPNHWVLIITNLETRELLIFDSKSNYGPKEEIDNYLKKLLNILGETFPSSDNQKTPFILKRMIHKQLQRDGSTCGPWILFFFEKYLENPHQDFNLLTQSDLTAYLHILEKRMLTIYPTLSPKEQDLVNIYASQI